MNSTWQTLLRKALEENPIETGPNGRCGFWGIRRYLFTSLQKAGIENRPPFNLWQVLTITFKSKGQPLAIRHLCLELLAQMQGPNARYDNNYLTDFLIILGISSSLLIAPKIATTFKAPTAEQPILIENLFPQADLDSLTQHLALTSDYLDAPSLYLTPEELHTTTKQGLRNATWITTRDDSAYSLQLLSASNKDNLLIFCEKHKICDKTAFYESTVKGKTLYRLLYGDFRNHQTAKLAKTTLPPALQKLSPWARSFAQIKREL